MADRLGLAVDRWSATPIGSPRPGSDSLLLDVRLPDGRSALLKVAHRRVHARRELAAIQAYGDLAAPVLAAADDLAALLIGRVEPGTPLSLRLEVDDDGATLAAAELVIDLRQVTGARGLPALGRAAPAWLTWARRPVVAAAVGRAWLDRATGVARALLESAPSPVVLHGDLHHDNILRATHRPYVVVDPQGLVGDPTYDLACLLRNPIDAAIPGIDPAALLERRIAILADRLGDPPDRILAWTFVGAVISAAWSASAGEDPRPALAVADRAHQLTREDQRRAASAAPRSRRPS